MDTKNIRLGVGNYFLQFTIGGSWQLLLRIGFKGYAINKYKGFHIRNYKLNCEEYDISCAKEKVMYCIDCEKNTPHQLGYTKDSSKSKIIFCTVCGKAYFNDWE